MSLSIFAVTTRVFGECKSLTKLIFPFVNPKSMRSAGRLVLFFIATLSGLSVFGQVSTAQAGPWHLPSTWVGLSVPNSTFGSITVNHAVTVDAPTYGTGTPLQVDQLTVGATGSLTINSGAAIQIMNQPSSTDLTVNATGVFTAMSGSEFLIASGASFSTTSGNTVFQSGSLIRTASANLPLATGLDGIDIYIEGVTGANLTLAGSWSQVGANTNLHVNCPALGNFQIRFAGIISSLKSLNVISTNGSSGGSVALVTSGTSTLSVGSGGVTVSGDSRLFLATTGTSTLNLTGDFTFSSTSSSANYSQCATSGTGTINFNGGDFIMTSGFWRMAASGNDGDGYFNFNNSTSDMLVTGGVISEIGNLTAQGTVSFLAASGNQTLNWPVASVGTGTLNLIVNKASGNVNLTDDFTIGGFTLTIGNFITNGNDLTLTGNVSMPSGQIGATTGTSFTISGAGTLPFSIPFVASSILSNLTLNRTGALLAMTNVSISDGGLITITAGSLITAITPLGVYDVLYNNTAALTTGSEIPVSSSVLRNLTHAGTATVNLASTATINGNLTINTNTLAASTNNVSLVGDFTNNGAFTQSAGTTFTFLTRSPSNVHSLSGTSNSTFGALIINGDLTVSNLTTTLLGNLTVQASSSLNATSGTFAFNAVIVITNNGNSIQFKAISIGTGFSMTPPASGTFSVAGNWSGNGTFTHNGSTVIFNGTTTLSGSAKTFNNVTVSSGASLSGTIGWTILSNLINDGSISFTAGTLTWNSNGTFSGTSNASLFNLTVSSTKTLNLTLAANLTLGNNLSLTGNVNHTSSNDLSIGGNMSANGSITSSGRVIFAGAASAMSGSGAKTFTSLRVTGTLTVSANTSYTLTTGGTLDVSGTLNTNAGGSSQTFITGVTSVLNSGTSTTLGRLNISGALTASGTINLNSDFINTGTFNHGNGTIGFNSSGALTKNITSSATIEFNNITINNNGNVTADVRNNVTGILNLRGVLTINDAIFDADGSADDKVFVVQSLGDSPTQDASIAPMSATASVSGNITVQRYMGDEGQVNRYISSPVTGETVAGLFDDFTTPRNLITWYREWVTGAYSKGFNSGGAATVLTSGRGYLAMPVGGGTITWDLTGPLTSGSNKGDVNLNVTYTVSSPALPDEDGWNLVGNPYPSSVVWTTLDASKWTVTNIDPVITVYDVGNNASFTWDGSSGTGDLPGGIVSMGQAFWLHANALLPSLIVHENAKTSTSGEFFRKSASDLPAGLKVSLTNGIYRDNSFLLIREGATDNYDRGMDAAKLEGEKLAISFQDARGTKYAHYATDGIVNPIPLYIHAANEGEYAIGFEPVRNFAEFNDLFLVDAYLGKTHSLASNTPYSFSVSPNTNTKVGRFFLSKEAGSVKVKELTVSVWPNPVESIFNLEVNTHHPVAVDVLNNNGQPILSSQIIPFNGIARTKIDMTEKPSGLYFVKSTINGKVVVSKIWKK